MEGKSILILASIILTHLIFPTLNLYLITFIALLPLIHATQQAPTPKKAAKIGWIYGTATMALFHTWMFTLTAWAPLPGVLLMWSIYSLYLGGFYACAIGLYKKLTLNKPFNPLLFTTLWILFEWLRTLGPIGNPAGIIGYSQTWNHPLLQLAAITGVLGLSAVCILTNSWLYQFISNSPLKTLKQPKISTLLPLLNIILLLLPILLIGTHRLSTPTNAPTTTIAIIQANHDQHTKLNSSNWYQIRQTYLTQTLKLLSQENPPTLILWPETVTAGNNLADQSLIPPLQKAAQQSGSSILFGTPEYDYIKGKKYYFNSIAAITPSTNIQLSRKTKLMPFGEYWPFRPLLYALGLKNWIPKTEYTKGNQTLLHTPHHKIGTSICLESLYPNPLKTATKQGATLLTTHVNNAWFGNSKAAQQHLQMSILRSVENNRYLLQAANTGISAIITNKGIILKQSQLNSNEILTSTVHLLSH